MQLHSIKIRMIDIFRMVITPWDLTVYRAMYDTMDRPFLEIEHVQGLSEHELLLAQQNLAVKYQSTYIHLFRFEICKQVVYINNSLSLMY